MSKPIPQQELNKKLSYKIKQWIDGEADIYEGNIETVPKEEEVLSEIIIDSHKRDMEQVVQHVYDTEHNENYKLFFRFYRIASIVCCVLLVAILLVAVSYLPPVGNADNPVNNEVSAKYIEEGMQETGAVNIVTGMILDYRAFDTFGESNVLFIATCTVLILMRNDKRDKNGVLESEKSDRYFEPKADTILQKMAFILVPIIMIFGIYIVLNGHISPGGGFSGGAIIGAGLILYLGAFGFKKTERFFTEKTYKSISLCSLLFYCLAKSYSFFMGANHLETGIPLGTPGDIISSGLILPLNICVGLVVACTMYTFYALFRKGGF